MNSQQTVAPRVETDHLTSEESAETVPAQPDARLDWPVIGWIAVIHLGLLAGFCFWLGIGLFVDDCQVGDILAFKLLDFLSGQHGGLGGDVSRCIVFSC